VILHDVFSVNEAATRPLRLKDCKTESVAEKTSSSTKTQQGSTSGDRPPARKATDAFTANPATTATPTIKGKENSYAKPGVGKCYRCGEPKHKSNKCPRRQVNMADYEDEDEVNVDIEPEEFDFSEEYGE